MFVRAFCVLHHVGHANAARCMLRMHVCVHVCLPHVACRPPAVALYLTTFLGLVRSFVRRRLTGLDAKRPETLGHDTTHHGAFRGTSRCRCIASEPSQSGQSLPRPLASPPPLSLRQERPKGPGPRQGRRQAAQQQRQPQPQQGQEQRAKRRRRRRRGLF